MTAWQDQLNGDSLHWLLESDIPGVRYLVLRHLLDRPSDDPELCAARTAAYTNGPIATILAQMDQAATGPNLDRATVWSLLLLAQLGASADQNERIMRDCTYLLDGCVTLRLPGKS
jgi:hypothetical protein